jgi:hypothetical protein
MSQHLPHLGSLRDSPEKVQNSCPCDGLPRAFKAFPSPSFTAFVNTVVTKWRAPSNRRSRDFRWLGLVLGGGLLGFGLLRGGAEAQPAAAYTSCSGVRECRKLLSEAELRLDSCAFSCQEEQAQHLTARNSFRDALEQAAEQEHKAELRQLQERQQLERAHLEATREQQRLLDAKERDQEHQRQLELLEAQAKQRAVALAAEHAEKVRYLSRLTLEQRKQRVTACHAQRAGACEELAELLVESAARASERRAVIELHERLVNGRSVTPSKAPSVSTAVAAVPEATPAAPIETTPAVQERSCAAVPASAGSVCAEESGRVAIVVPAG